MATLTASPTEGEFGTSISLTGTGFAALTDITIKWDSDTDIPFTVVTTPTTITTDGIGDFTATIVPPNHEHDDHEIEASDGTTTATDIFTVTRKPKYCMVEDVADWLRITINANTDPSRKMIEDYIIENEDEMDNVMLHTFLPERRVQQTFDVNRVWDWGRGLPIYPRHRGLKDFDITKGDKLEIWTGSGWQDQSQNRIFFELRKGVIYLRGYLFTILTKMRFRITYRYGQNFDGMQKIPNDIKKCCKLMTAINVLETDFAMSQIPYGGEGNVDKDKIMTRWQTRIDRILQRRSELVTVW